jgi:exodeoxyribonuclease VII small subunit
MSKNRSEHPSGHTEAPDAAAAFNGPADSAGRKDQAASAPTFEDAMIRLESIVHDLEEGRVGLADALARYEEGVALLRHCHDLLDRAERRIELLSGVDADGKPVVAPYDDTPLTLEEKAAQRGRRRSVGEAPGTPGTPGKTRKSPRPSKTEAGLGDDVSRPPSRSGPSLFGEGDSPEDGPSDLF